MSTKKIIILDVEGMQTCRPYNVGYIIADKYGNIYKKYNFAFHSCIWENIQHLINDEKVKTYTKATVEEILQDNDLYNQKFVHTTPKHFYVTLFNDVIDYKISEIWAYNATFDKNALKRLDETFYYSLTKQFNVKFFDIIPAILHTRLLTKKYVNYCIKNNYLTEKKNVRYTAEIVYRYLSGDKNFNEMHQGLDDVLIEYKILLYALKTKKKILQNTTPPWQIIKKFCETQDIII